MALHFAAGCVGGCAGILVGHPFDTIKVNLQTQDFRNPQYRGTFHCLKTIIARDSVSALYRGMSSPIAGIAVVNAIVFGVYGNVQRHMADPDSLRSHFVAGAISGLAQSFVCGPLELAKTRMQLQGANGFTNPLQCISHIVRTNGLRGVFKGLGMTALRDCPAIGSYFLSYEMLTRNVEGPVSTGRTLLAGGLAGTISWLVTFPVDVVKSRLQADGMSGTSKYSGAMDCVRKSLQTEGYSFFTRGLSSTLLRAFPTNAATFVVVNWCFRMFGDVANTEIYLNPTESIPLTIIAAGLQKKEESVVSNWKVGLYSWFEKNLPAPSTHKTCVTYRSLLILGAFHEAVCASDLEDITCSCCYESSVVEQYLGTNDLMEDLEFEHDDEVDMMMITSGEISCS